MVKIPKLVALETYIHTSKFLFRENSGATSLRVKIIKMAVTTA